MEDVPGNKNEVKVPKSMSRLMTQEGVLLLNK